MKAVYLHTNGDTTIDLPIPLEVEGYSVGVIEMSGRVKMDLETPFFFVVIFVKNLWLITLKCQFLDT